MTWTARPPRRSPRTWRPSANPALPRWSTSPTRRTTPSGTALRYALSSAPPPTRGTSADFLRKHGAADGRFYYERGTDAVIFGIGGDGLHGPDEYADLTTITPYYQALKDFLANPGGGSFSGARWSPGRA